MGTFHWRIAIGDLQGEHFEEIDALVDTGATYTWIPRDVLARLGHKPTFQRRLLLADKRVIERDATIVPIRIGTDAIPTVCIFGDEGSQALLGAVTMEEFSLAPDPLSQRLVPTTGLLMTLYRGPSDASR